MTARFKDLIAEFLDFAQFPFKADTTHCGAIAHEIAELQVDNEARIDFDVFQDIAKFCIQLPNKHSKIEPCKFLCDSESLTYVRQDFH